jgi:hypothetical protein
VKKPEIAPHLDPNNYEVADAYAIQALVRGDASPEMQRRAIDWIINRAAHTYDQSFYPADANLTAFAEGMRSVGNQIVKLSKLDTKLLAQQQQKER